MRPVLAHGHIFKNAGTTLDWSLRRNFKDRFKAVADELRMRNEGLDYWRELISSNPGMSAFTTHHLCTPPDAGDIFWVRVFMLRHPLERVASVYHFERKQQAQTPGALAAKEKSFPDYVAWRLQPGVAHTIRNYQTCYLAGNHSNGADRGPSLPLLQQALATVAGEAFVGLVERYDESMVVLEHQLREHWPQLDMAYLRQNEGNRQQLSVAEILSEVGPRQQDLIDHNSLDLALYQVAAKRLDAAVAAVPDFEERLEAFRSRCSALA